MGEHGGYERIAINHMTSRTNGLCERFVKLGKKLSGLVPVVGLNVKHVLGGIGALIQAVDDEFGLKADELKLIQSCCGAFSAALKLMESGVLAATPDVDCAKALQNALDALKDLVLQACKVCMHVNPTGRDTTAKAERTSGGKLKAAFRSGARVARDALKSSFGIINETLVEFGLDIALDDMKSPDTDSLQRALTELIADLSLTGEVAIAHWVGLCRFVFLFVGSCVHCSA